MSRRPLAPVIQIAMLLALAAVPVAASNSSVDVHPWVLEHTAGGKTAEMLVVLRDTADLSGAASLENKEARGRYVVDTLRAAANRSQPALRRWLDERGIPNRPFYIVNAIWVRGDRQLVDQLARREDVLRIEGNPQIQNRLPAPVVAPPVSSPAGIEWGISRTHAPDVWALGFTGQGVVVAGQDTGIDWDHPALKGHYRGWDGANASHDYNWHDSIHDAVGNPCGNDSPVPCDDHGHGTHTIGTVAGDDGAGNQIGMAPGAKWIGCRNMASGIGTPARYLECFEFFLAPYPVGETPAQGDPAKAPDVTNNSWGCPPDEGCSWNTLKSAVEAQRAAGIMTVVSAGNDGPACGTVHDPPALYDAAYSVGATTSSDNLSSFSSRGPASNNLDNPTLMKPDISAPGSGVRSAYPGGGYTTMSGTSMAGPHVAGAVALAWSAKPALKNNQTATENLLNGSAFPLTSVVEGCGGDYVNGPNNSWGYGLVDVKAALSEDITLQPVAVSVTETSGNLNGVLEPGEVFSLSPTWFNPGSLPVPAVTGSATVGTGLNPGSTDADYGTIAAGASRSCVYTGNCYSALVASSRPTGHVDRTITETVSNGETHDWLLHIGESFDDVPGSYWAYGFIETILHNQVTAGCGATAFCPEALVTRWQMAPFIAAAQVGAAQVPYSGTVPGMGPFDCTTGGVSVFSDVSPVDPACRFIHYLAVHGITAGCGGGSYCPADNVDRWQMAVFLSAAMLDGNPIPTTGTVPGMGPYDCSPGGTSVFSDVLPQDGGCPAIHFIAANGITAGCGGGNYCPQDSLSRAQMSVFLTAAFDLALYGP